MKRALFGCVYYAALPALVVLVFIWSYAYGPPLLQQLMCPDVLSSVPLRSRREFGLVEGVTHLALFASTWVATYSAIFRRELRLFFCVAAAGSFGWLLEEIDYGWHYAYFLVGGRPWVGFNLHNDVEGLNAAFGSVVYWSGLALSGLSLGLFRYRARERGRALIPSPTLVIFFPMFVAFTDLSSYLFTNSPDFAGRPMNQGSLSLSTREFVELYCSLIAFLYVLDVRFRLTHPPPELGSSPPR